MNQHQLDTFKKELLNEKDKIESYLQDPQEFNISGDSSDEMAKEVTSLEEFSAVKKSLELRLKQILETLNRIAGGSFGLCNTCKSSIESKRLQAMPEVSLCLACASKNTLT